MIPTDLETFQVIGGIRKKSYLDDLGVFTSITRFQTILVMPE
jgi:hypothetical protein